MHKILFYNKFIIYFEHMWSSWGGQNCITQPLASSHYPVGVIVKLYTAKTCILFAAVSQSIVIQCATFNTIVYITAISYMRSLDSSVGIATRYGLDGPGIESRGERDFPHASRLTLGPTQPPLQRVPCLSRGKAAGTWRWPLTPPPHLEPRLRKE